MVLDTLPKYGTDIAAYARQVIPTIGGQEKLDFNTDLAKKFSSMIAPKPSPSMSAGASWSQFWNNIIDWFGYYGSPANKVRMGTSETEDGFKDACKYLDSPLKVNQFRLHHYAYKADQTDSDEWKPPHDVFASRWDSFPNAGKIGDDCEGISGLSQYCIMQATGQGPQSIINDYNSGMDNNIIFGMFSDTTGHATNKHGKVTVCNFGRIDHGTDDTIAVGRDFISDASWFSRYVWMNGDYQMIEAGDTAVYSMSASTREEMKASDKKPFAILTPEVLAKILKKADVKDGVLDFAREGLGYTDNGMRALKQGLNRELNQKTPLHGMLARKLGKRISAVKIA